jgi:uncharacterized membrane protein
VPAAILISILFITGGWIVYDLLCRSPLGRNDAALGVVLLVLATLLARSLSEVFSGRGAYIHYGATLGTIMVANVFFVIIPGQRKMVEAAGRGEAPDPEPGIRAKQRSVHNTYFTLPVLFVMIGNHYAMTYAHAWNWLILIAFSLAGALIRGYFVARHKGNASPLPIIVAGIILLATAAALAPRSGAGGAGEVTLADIQPIITARCTACHSETPTFPSFPSGAAGVMLDTAEQMQAAAEYIHRQTVVLKAMPIGNVTQMTDEERRMIDAWYRGMENSR